jgi:hypothetical protein
LPSELLTGLAIDETGFWKQITNKCAEINFKEVLPSKQPFKNSLCVPNYSPAGTDRQDEIKVKVRQEILGTRLRRKSRGRTRGTRLKRDGKGNSDMNFEPESRKIK